MTTTPNAGSAAGIDLAELALIEFEQYLRSASTVVGMPGLRAKPCFVAGFNAALARSTPQPSADRAPDAWHAAVLTECMRVEAGYHADDPARTLKELIDWHANSGDIASTNKILADNYLKLTSADRAPADGAGELIRETAGRMISLLEQADKTASERHDSLFSGMLRTLKTLANVIRRAAEKAAPTAGDSATPQPAESAASSAAPTGEQLYRSWQHSQSNRGSLPPWEKLPASTQIHWNKQAIYGATPQHSVAEQDAIDLVISGVRREAKRVEDILRAENSQLRAVLAQPLASTAVTQPEQASERALDLYDAIECDLASLFGRASSYGHEVGQQLASEVRTKMQQARAALAIQASTSIRDAALDDAANAVASSNTLGMTATAAITKLCAKIRALKGIQASTAATQPEQTSGRTAYLDPLSPVYVKPWAQRLFNPGSRNIQTAMDAEIADLRGALAIPASTAASEQHPDDAAVDRFAAAMRAKMATSRAKGRGGWDDPAACSAARLQVMLVEHLAKGDPVDIGNFAMMLWNRGERTTDVGIAFRNDGQEPDWNAYAASEQQAGADERALFDAWAEDNRSTLVQEGCGYRDNFTPYARKGWMARAALTHRATTATSKDVQTTSKTAATAAPGFDQAELMRLVREFAEVVYGVRRTTEDVGKNLIDYVKSLAAAPGIATTAATCWSCKRPYTAEQRADADGDCPHCGVEIEDDATTAADQQDAAQAQAGDDARDAGRYRWLRNSASWGIAVYEAIGHGTREDIDAAIDAAMAAPATSGGENG